METLNFSFWQEIYSIAMGAISMFLVIVIHVYFRELKRLGLVPLWLWPSFIVGMPLVVGFAYWQQRYRFFIGCTLVFCRKYAHLLGN